MKNVMLSVAAMCAAAGCVALAQTAPARSAVTGSARPAGAAQQTPSAPTPGATAAGIGSPAQALPPSAPAAPIQFPPVDPKNFTAPSPTRETVDSFLHAVWGLDEYREWRVVGIQPSSVPGFTRVEVYVADRRQPNRIGNYSFLITPDGKHAVQGELAPFGAHPFEETRMTLQQRADGPFRGAASKDLEIVEFADLQCPSCRAAQGMMNQIVQDFPQAHFVYQNLPLETVHPKALQAAEVGLCVRQAKGDPAFFTYAQKVYDTQTDLTPEKADATLRAAVTAAGADPASVMTCAGTPATLAAVNASLKLASDLNINSTPTLVINGRIVPLSGQISYPALKQVIVYQGKLDGLAVKEQPSLSNLK